MAHHLQGVTACALLLASAAAQPRPVATAQAPQLKPFSHKTHLQLGNIAPVIAAAIDKGTYLSPPGNERAQLNTGNPCLACHHGIENADAAMKRTFLRMADCLVCHNKVDPPDSCSFCHLAGANLKPANHTPDFLESHSRKNAKLDMATCAVCHGRKFTCLGCHL